jgi:ABC-type sugar transport system substrate-binding protein
MKYVRLILLLLLVLKFDVANASTKVVFVNPGYSGSNETGEFWQKVDWFMSAAAMDLNIELKTLYANRNHIYMRALALEAVRENPDYIVVVNEKNAALNMVEDIAHSNIPVVVLLNDLTKEQYQDLSPMGHKHIISAITPNNFDAGYIQAMALFSDSLKPINIVALRGDYVTEAAIERYKGFMNALNKTNHKLTAEKVVNWSEQQAYEAIDKWLQRNISIDAVWSANDPIGIGAKKALIHYGRNARVGGINWDEPELTKQLYVSVGGHVTLGALAMMRIAQYQSKADIPRKEVVSIFQTNKATEYQKFSVLTNKASIETIDFSLLNKKISEGQPFSIRNIVDSIKINIKKESQ